MQGKERDIKIYKLNQNIDALAEEQSKHKYQFPAIVNTRNKLIEEVTELVKEMEKYKPVKL